MKKKTYLFVLTLLLFAMVMGACAPAAQPTAEAPVVEAPTEAPAATEVPTEVPVVVEAPDFQALFADVIANNPKEKGYGTIGADALNTEMVDNPNLFVLDVRQPAETTDPGHIDGAVNIPLRELMDNLDKLPGLNDPIVVYCKSGHRATLAFDALEVMGYSNVRNLGGGIAAWMNAGLPVVTDAPAPAESISTPVVENEALFTAVHDFIVNIPEGWYATSNTAVNDMLINGEAFTLVDVRRPEEYADGYIDTAVNIPLEDIMASLDQLPDKDAKIVLYCKSGIRSAIATEALLMNGYTNALSMGGGYVGWTGAELPVVGAAPDFQALFAKVIAANPQDKGYGTISASDLNTELVENPDLFILDVRQPAETADPGHIEGSVNVPLRELMDNLDKLPALDDPIVVYCKSGHRATLAFDALELMGYTNVRNLGGGIAAWMGADLPVVTEQTAAAESITTPIVFDEKLFNAVHDFVANIPENWYATNSAAVNEMIVNGETFTLVDTRRPEEYAEGHVEGAISIPLETIMTDLSLLPDKEAKIVVYCKSGIRSAMATNALLMNGYNNALSMAGGILAWQAAELPVVQ